MSFLAVGESGNGEINRGQVVDGVPLNNGDPTWQAEILVPPPGGGLNHSGKMRTMCIRGPSRIAYDQAQRDARMFDDVAAEGPKAVRACANQMQRTKKRYDMEA